MAMELISTILNQLAELFQQLSAVDIMILLVASFIGSLMTAALGVGGGAFLITVMASIMPPLALVPLHGIAQFGSNASRGWLARKHLNAFVALWFALGAIVAAIISIWLIGSIDPGMIPLLIALFILWLSWGKVPDIGLNSTKVGLLVGGWLTTALTMLVGATGPLVSAWLGRAEGDRWQYTANFSFCMSLQHLLKIAVFALAGFSYSEWLPLLTAMILTGFIGTKVGLALLGKIPEKLFRQLFKWLLTLLSLRLIWQWWVQ